MIRHESRAESLLAVRRACDELSSKLRAGISCRAEEIFDTQPSLVFDSDAALELLYTEFVVREQLGQQPQVQEWLDRFPQWRDELRQLFEIHAVVGHNPTRRVGPSGTQIEDPAFYRETAPPRPVFIGGYELLGEIGRGGMGVVYRARQRGLARIVALKMMLSPHGECARARFRTEAEATARLSHPNIVQIYEVGQEGDLPFLSMEFVAGKSLDKHLAAATLAASAAAELLRNLARAVAYAHDQGIIHRDLKPANIVLTADGSPKITDFGVARQLILTQTPHEAQAHAPPSVAVVGTPSYMAPEQCRPGSNVGPAADLYALGAILYEALTGRPPFRGETAVDIWELVRSQEPVAPRQLISKVPRDLETICLKCLAKQPEQRYPTAATLADDLARFLAGKPILARPVGRAERAVRWCRRNPVIALLISVTALTLICGSAISISLAVWALNERDKAAENARQARASAREEQVARELAEYRLIQAEKAVEEYLGFENNELLKEANFLALRKQLLTSAVPFYEDFVRAKPGDANLETKRGRAYGRLAAIRRQLGEYEQAAADIQQKKAIFQKLAIAFPDVPEYRQQQAVSYHALAYLLRDLGRRDQAMAEIRQAIALQQELTTSFPAVVAYHQEFAESRHMFGMLLADAGNYAAAKEEYASVLALEEQLVAEFPANPTYRRDLASTYNNMANTLAALGKPEDGLDAIRQALVLTEALAAEFPKATTYRRSLGIHHFNLGVFLSRLKDRTGAETEYRQAIALGQSLADDFPTVPDYRLDLADRHYTLARLLRGQKRLEEAEIEYRDALTLRNKLNTQVSGVPEYRADLAESYAGLGSVLHAQGKRADAIIEIQRAIDIWALLFKDFPDFRDHRHSFASHSNTLALLLREDGKLDEARRMHELAIETCDALVLATPNNRAYKTSLRGYCRELCRTALAQKDHAALADAASRMAQVQPNGPTDAELAARYLGHCILLAEQDSQHSDAERAALAASYTQQTMDHLREAVDLGYSNIRHLKSSVAFVPLRGRADFQQLIRDLEAR